MVSTYDLKKNPLEGQRYNRVAKAILDNAKEDRKKALETYDLLKDKAFNTKLGEDIEIVDSDCVKGMVDCLKLAQSANVNVLKLLDQHSKTTKTSQTKGARKKTSLEDFEGLLTD